MTDSNRRTFLGQGLIAAGGTLVPSPRTSDPRWDMINALGAPGPHLTSTDAPQARVFDRLIGSWDAQYVAIHDDGSRERSEGQLIVGWILDGRAVQDIWIWQEPGQEERWMGTTIRFFDPSRRVWRIVWTSPFARAVTLLEGGGDATRIELLGDGGSRGRLRWTFNDMTADAFIWRGESSMDGGTTWRLREEHHMRRVLPR